MKEKLNTKIENFEKYFYDGPQHYKKFGAQLIFNIQASIQYSTEYLPCNLVSPNPSLHPSKLFHQNVDPAWAAFFYSTYYKHEYLCIVLCNGVLDLLMPQQVGINCWELRVEVRTVEQVSRLFCTSTRVLVPYLYLVVKS